MSIKQLLERVNLITVVEQDAGQPVQNGRWLTYRCPCHEDRHPSLAITPDRKRWVCFGRCSTSGDAIDWVQRRHGLDFKAACARVESLVRVAPAHPVVVPEFGFPWQEPESPPPAEWQAAARQMIKGKHNVLTAPEAWRARDYLAQRGLTDETIEYWQIGFNSWPHASTDMPGVKVPRGLFIPWIEREKVWAIKIRLTDDEDQGVTRAPKYVQIPGGRPALFGAHTLAGHDAAIVTEGEFDAMLVHQVAGDLVGVVTAGSASTHLGWTWLKDFLPIQHILAAHDEDEAGARAASGWQALSARVHRVRVPIGKDITEFAQRGGDVRAWVTLALRNARRWS